MDGAWCVERVACREADNVEGEGGKEIGGIRGAGVGGVGGVAGSDTS